MTDAKFDKACKLHQNNDLDEAEALYREVIREAPDHADALHQLGALVMQAHGANQFEEAEELLKRAIVLDPRSAKYRFSLGRALEHRELWQRAVDAYERAAEKDPTNTQYRMALVRPLTRLKRHARVVEVCRTVLAQEPDHAAANLKCGAAHRALRQLDAALACYRRHLEHDPDDERAKFWAAVLAGESVPCAPASHVTGLFDYYADIFEEHLVQSLKYSTPSVLMERVLRVAERDGGGVRGEGGARWQRCVDLGCGTGLMGPLLREHVARLEGVDLSAKMVEKAREKGCYDDLAVGDITQYLRERGGARAQLCDLLVAADVLVYVGDLRPFVRAATAAAAEGAVLAFSTERNQGDALECGYRAELTGRFSHDSAYVVSMAAEFGWEVADQSMEVIRMNAGKPTIGDLFVFVKSD